MNVTDHPLRLRSVCHDQRPALLEPWSCADPTHLSKTTDDVPPGCAEDSDHALCSGHEADTLDLHSNSSSPLSSTPVLVVKQLTT
eukprot:13523154-Ditylum_brightwellii.AAC.1